MPIEFMICIYNFQYIKLIIYKVQNAKVPTNEIWAGNPSKCIKLIK